MAALPVALRRVLLGPAALLLLSACAMRPVIDFDPPAQTVELRETPFFPQTEHHCGPAALATVLVAQGVQTTPGQLAQWVYVPGREGSLQTEMLSAARRFDRLPVKLGGSLQVLLQTVQAGHPVLVLQNLGLRRWPRWHYAVLIGYDPAQKEFLLRSGTTERETLSVARFTSSWERADRWAVVLAPAVAVPVTVGTQGWLAAAAPFESLGRLEVAEQAYRAAVQRWPQSALPWQALANARYAAGDNAGAEAALLRAVSLDPQAVVARNNLANLLLRRGCIAAAGAHMQALDEVPPRFETAVAQTRSKIDAAVASGQRAESAQCPRP